MKNPYFFEQAYDYSPYQPMRYLRINVTSECTPKDMYYEDVPVAGVYFVPVPVDFDDAQAVACALGVFHSYVPVKYVDCFDIEVSDAVTLEVLEEPENLDYFEHVHLAGRLVCAKMQYAHLLT